MGQQWRTADGEWTVEHVVLSCTPNHHDGQWLRVRYHGYYVEDVRSPAELSEHVPLTELEPYELIAA
ncbi:MAG: hypothetical protein ACRDRJ_05120 [Streptosporangiaceae bacterium]